jgi:hypothetical protein
MKFQSNYKHHKSWYWLPLQHDDDDDDDDDDVDDAREHHNILYAKLLYVTEV